MSNDSHWFDQPPVYRRTALVETGRRISLYGRLDCPRVDRGWRIAVFRHYRVTITSYFKGFSERRTAERRVPLVGGRIRNEMIGRMERGTEGATD